MARQKGLRMAWGFWDRPSRKMRMKKSHGVPIMTHPWPFFWGSRRELYPLRRRELPHYGAGNCPTAAQGTAPLRRRDLHPGTEGAIFTGAGIVMLVKKRRASAEFPFQARDLFPQQTIFSQHVCLLP